MVRGSTPEARVESRARQTRTRRGKHYQARIHAAPTAKARLAEACQFLRAVADDLTDTDRDAIAAQVVAIANERSRTR
jgi:hypothetical protein